MVLSVVAGDIFAERRGTGDSGVVGVGALGSETTDSTSFGRGFFPEIPGEQHMIITFKASLEEKKHTLDVPKKIASDQLKSMGFSLNKKMQNKFTQSKPTPIQVAG